MLVIPLLPEKNVLLKANIVTEVMMEHLKTLLIANRAEIATRILRTAK